VAKTVADTSASKRHCKKGGSISRLSTSIVTDLLVVFRMPKNKPTSTGPMRMQPLERGSIMPTQGLPMMQLLEMRRSRRNRNNSQQGRSSPRGQSENNAEQFPAEAAGCPKELNNAALISGIDFLIQVVKVR
jgi:hypothetical protein